MEAGESGGDGTVAVFHVDDDKVVAGEGGDLGEGRGEGEEEEAVEGFATFEAGFEGFWRGVWGESGRGDCGGGGLDFEG